MSSHKGHGSGLFKTYQQIAAFCLIGNVLGGFFVGVLVPAYRFMTLLTAAIGAATFFIVAFAV